MQQLQKKFAIFLGFFINRRESYFLIICLLNSMRLLIEQNKELTCEPSMDSWAIKARSVISSTCGFSIASTK